MKHGPIPSRKRKPINLSIDPEVLAAARETGINISRITEDALRAAVKVERERLWQEENRDALAAFGDWYAREGDPLEGLRVR